MLSGEDMWCSQEAGMETLLSVPMSGIFSCSIVVSPVCEGFVVGWVLHYVMSDVDAALYRFGGDPAVSWGCHFECCGRRSVKWGWIAAFGVVFLWIALCFFFGIQKSSQIHKICFFLQQQSSLALITAVFLLTVLHADEVGDTLPAMAHFSYYGMFHAGAYRALKTVHICRK